MPDYDKSPFFPATYKGPTDLIYFPGNTYGLGIIRN
jgi:hypothetical protein